MGMSKEAILGKMRLYVLLSPAHCKRPILDAARAVVDGGADVVQLRCKETSDREIVRFSRDLRKMTENAGVGFIMNDRADLAKLVNADGVHLGQEDIPPAAARKVLRRAQIVGVSTHTVEQARQAVADGADYIGVGPIYPTQTRGYEKGVGVEHLKAVAAEVELPLVAIGGITLNNVGAILAAAPNRHVAIAVCAAIIGAEDIRATTESFKTAIERAAGR